MQEGQRGGGLRPEVSGSGQGFAPLKPQAWRCDDGDVVVIWTAAGMPGEQRLRSIATVRHRSLNRNWSAVCSFRIAVVEVVMQRTTFPDSDIRLDRILVASAKPRIGVEYKDLSIRTSQDYGFDHRRPMDQRCWFSSGVCLIPRHANCGSREDLRHLLRPVQRA